MCVVAVVVAVVAAVGDGGFVVVAALFPFSSPKTSRVHS